MTRPVASASPAAGASASAFVRPLGLAALACVAVLTLADRGATRMHAWPWSLVLAGAQFIPLAALALRTLPSAEPPRLPSRVWCVAAALAAISVIASALASPFRGPSVLGAATPLSAIAGFFLMHDWFTRGGEGARATFARLAAWCAAVAACVSLGMWLWQDLLPSGEWHSFAELAGHRNASPLGHSNYTAGLALLLLPWPALRAWTARGIARAASSGVVLLVLAMLFTSSSRGGLVGLAALTVAALSLARLGRKRLALLGGAALAVGALLAVANPRLRSLFRPADPGDVISQSNVQRTAMLTAGVRMGADRPLLGWGPETTPLVFPRYRAGLEGGTENVLQLHAAPVQLWAEHGALGFAVALAVVVLALRDARRQPLVGATLLGYAVFSLTDWQLDVPIFAFGIAALAAGLAPPTEIRGASRAIGVAALVALALVALLGRHDSAPEVNVRALALAREPANTDRAIALLRESLALNPDQEIAHFNLGWLLVARDAAAAEKHFLAAARLVPDKGGVYFGLGLARLKLGRRDDVARAFALECLNDPAFLRSAWWREPAIAALRDATRAEFSRLAARAKNSLPADSWLAAQLARVTALAPTLGDAPIGAERTFFRERVGYPVLMRNLDLATPADLFLVREVADVPTADLPPKGWLPSPLLLTLLDAPPRK